MNKVGKHILNINESVKAAMQAINELGLDGVLFITNNNNQLIGSLTDGDLRRGFVNNLDFDTPLSEFIQSTPKKLVKNQFSFSEVEAFKKSGVIIVPIINEGEEVVDVLNFRIQKTVLPLHGFIMAGGEGKRLRPLTLETPKPLLKVGDKPIIEHNIDRLISFGIKNIDISINYLGDQLVDYFDDGSKKKSQIKYVKEDKPLGTIGSILLAEEFTEDSVLVMNSDLLTNIDYADMYRSFVKSGADMTVAATSYSVDVPYAVMEVENGGNNVVSLREKPRYTYFSNAGIYIMKKEVLNLIPEGEFFDITDLMEVLLNEGKRITTYAIPGYWLDIGKPEDFKKAEKDINHIKF